MNLTFATISFIEFDINIPFLLSVIISWFDSIGVVARGVPQAKVSRIANCGLILSCLNGRIAN